MRLLAIAVLVAGCGHTTTSDSAPEVAASAGRATGGAQNGAGGGSASDAGQGGVEGSAFASLCSGAGWSSASQAVAVGLSGADVVVVSADGSQRVVATLGEAAGIPASDLRTGTVSTPDGAVVSTWWSVPEPPDGETVLLDRAGNVVWQLPGIVHTNAWTNQPIAGATGMVATFLGETKLVLADGTISDLPLGDQDGIYYFSDLQSDGWFGAMWAYDLELGPEGVDWHYGFLNLDGRPPRELATEPATVQGVHGRGGQAYYLSDPTSLSLYLETPAEARSIALGIEAPSATGYSAMMSKSRIVIAIDQRPSATVDPISGTVSAIDGATIDAMAGSDWYDIVLTPDSDFALGMMNYETPLFLLDTLSGAAEPVRLDLLAPLAPLDSPYCGDTLVLDDGRIGLGLRDAAHAGFYVAKADGTDFQRLGLPFRNVTAIRAEQVAGTWVLSGVSGINSYCSPFEPFAEPESSDPRALEGDVVQIVAPGAEPLVLPGPALVSLDATGLCALANTWPAADPETRVYDVTSGTSILLEGLSGVIWL